VRKTFFLFLLMAVTPFRGGSQEPVFFQRLPSGIALSQSTVNTIISDSTGFLWFGTEDGLNRYDGYKIKIYKQSFGEPGSISNSAIWTLFIDSQGRMWVGTFNGLNIYNDRKNAFTSFLHDADDPSSLSNNYVRAITEDSGHNIWVATVYGLNRFNSTDSTFTRFLHRPGGHNGTISSNMIFSLLVDHLGKLWAGTQMGLDVYDETEGSFTSYSLVKDGLIFPITSLFEDHRGRIWLGAGTGGLYRFDRKTESFLPVDLHALLHDPTAEINSIREDGNGRLWIGTTNGLIRFDPVGGEMQLFRYDAFNEQSLPDNAIRSIFIQDNGFIWIGTASGGVSFINPAKSRFHHLKIPYSPSKEYSDNQIRSFSEDLNGEIYIGSVRGVSLLDPATFTFRSPPAVLERAIGTKAVISMCKSRNGNMWAGTQLGLFRYDPRRKRIHLFRKNMSNPDDRHTIPDDHINALYEDRQGKLWIGTGSKGLCSYDPATGLFLRHRNTNPDALPGNGRIFAIIEDRQGNIWAATAGDGLNRYDPVRDTFTSFHSLGIDTSTFSFNFTLSLLEDHKGNIWSGTYGSGLIEYLPATGEFRKFTRSEGLPDDVIYGLLEDDHGRLWMSHNLGITCFDPVTGEITSYDKRDGLQNNEFNSGAYFRTRNGFFLFGGNNGFNLFHPDSIRQDLTLPPVVFTDLKIGNREILPGREYNGHVILKESIYKARNIYLHHSDRDIYIEFAALDYAIPGKNLYKYRLGRDTSWISLGNNNSIRFDHLPLGTVRLEVTGSNHDGIWNTRGTSITFLITPPFYKTLWFRILIVLLILLLTYILYILRTSQLRKQKEELQLLIQNKTREITKQRDALAAKNAELESKNREIRKERDKMEKMVLAVEEANQMKLQFFTNISHEFRTPLTLILNLIEKFRSESETYKKSERQHDYKLIEKYAQTLLKLIDKLMHFRKYTTGQAVLKIQETDLVRFVRSQASIFTSLSEKKKIDYRFDSHYQNIPLWFDPDQMEEVMTNLLSNAFKYTPEGGRIRVATGYADDPDVLDHTSRETERPGDFAYLLVEDTGPGIPEDKQKRVFDRFYQIEDPLHSDKRSGFGIGLHLTQRIVEMHKGKIFVHSIPGKGSLFMVLLRKGKDHLKEETEIRNKQYVPGNTLPVEEEEETPAILHEEENSNNVLEKLSRNKLPEILVIEDNKDLRNFIVRGLEEEFNMLEAGNGEEALRILEETAPEIVICDVLLPGRMNGFDITEHIKNDLSTSHIPVIMLTALNSQDQKILGLEKGADIYITKPFAFRELKAHIKSLIQLRESLKEKFRDYAFWAERELEISNNDETFIQRLIRIVETNMSDPAFDVNALSEAVNMSQTRLYRKVKSLTGMTIKEFIQGLRIRRAAALLLSREDKNISEIAYEIGFNDPNYFGKVFKSVYGMSPSEYIRKNSR